MIKLLKDFILFIIDYLSKKIGPVSLLRTINMIIFTSALAFWTFMSYWILKIFNLIVSFLSSIGSGASGGSGSDVMSLFWGVLNCSGIAPAIVSGLPLLLSAVSFYLMKISYFYFHNLAKDAVGAINNISKNTNPD